MGESGFKTVTDIHEAPQVQVVRENAADKGLLTKVLTDTESELSVITTACNAKPYLHSKTMGKVKTKLTLREYRMQVGIIHRKSNEKIGIKAKSESTLIALTETDVPKVSKGTWQNAEKSLLTQIAGNSLFQTKKATELELYASTSASNAKPLVHSNKLGKVKTKLTLREYRMQVGIKVQKTNQMKVKSESTLEEGIKKSETKAPVRFPVWQID